MNPEKHRTLTIKRQDGLDLWLESKLYGQRFLCYLPLAVQFVIPLSVMKVASFFEYNFVVDFKPLIGAMIYALGAIVDEESTIRTSEAIARFEQRTKIRSNFIESSPLAPERPNLDFFNSFRIRAINVAACTASVLIPSAGVGIGVGKLYAGWHNERVKALHERKLREFMEIKKHPNYYL